jgi:hypothetical protein
MTSSLPPDLQELDDAFEAIDRDARGIIDGLNEDMGGWRPAPGSWNVAECLDHLATGNRVYLDAMGPAAARAERDGRIRRGPARPGLVGGWFARYLEPPVNPRFKTKAPSAIRPRISPPLADAAAAFLTSHAEVRAFLRIYAGIDLASVRFPNPFVRGVRFSLASGLHVTAAHERRHLWQARRVREAAEGSSATRSVRPQRANDVDA